MADARINQPGDAIVVGAGWAGLSTAFHLSRQGFAVTVLEQTRQSGGRTFSFADRRSGEPLDNGEHVLLGLCGHFQQLLKAADLGSAVRFQQLLHVPVVAASADSSLGSHKLPGSLHLAGSVLRYKPLLPLERIKVLQTGLAVQMCSSADTFDDVSFADWLKDHRQSANAISVFWEAIGSGLLNAKADKVSAALALKTFRMLLSEGWNGARLGLFVRPLSEITHGFQSYLESRGVRFHFGCAVDAIEVQNSQGLSVSGPEGRWTANSVILTLPPDRLAKLVEKSGMTSTIAVPKFEFSPILNVYLFYDSKVLAQDFFLLPDDLGAMVFNRSRLLGAAKAESTTLAVSISAADDLREMPMQDISAMVEKMVRRRLRLPKAQQSRSVWQAHATFLARPGSERLRPGNRTAVDGLYLAGDWTSTGWPACLEGAVLSGHNAARETALRSERRRLRTANET